ncbi:SDR family NAD(P)-dependent oxidoreductase [Sphingomonas sp. CGMCC 1.13654]|uniref:SDR family NAD(P)-dependent oxidoreductase n=1 Tax=Sphingomonas chungangi TaxID=2683589 RepID=A0A838L884_9SPHN|nr:SDR family NAD(P)-dependent oxidoreductase [Sphingomonas chungangi]MBA2933748.1 SDR family NAD(P)-dependent oxidoreductase [Sphingomonas chungangi]
MDIGVAGRHAIICGGSRGISRAAADRLAAEGARVTLVARTAATLEQVAAEIAAATGAEVSFVATDLTSPEGRAHLIAERPAADILVTNAGVPQRPIPYRELDREEWIRWFDAHFFSAIDLIHAYAPGMCDRRFGRIVNVSANFIKFPQIGVGHSHAARLALAGAIASLVREVAPFNVSINSILPGLIDTEALRDALGQRAKAKGVTYETVEAEVRKRTAAGRLADPKEAGDLIAMLCAAQMGYVTGQNIVNDGGAFEGLF